MYPDTTLFNLSAVTYIILTCLYINVAGSSSCAQTKTHAASQQAN